MNAYSIKLFGIYCTYFIITSITIFVDSNDGMSILYLFTLFVNILHIKTQKINIYSLYCFAFFFLNIYVLLPVINYLLLLGEPIYIPPWEKSFTDLGHASFYVFLKVAIIASICYLVVYKRNRVCVQVGTNFHQVILLVLFLTGYLLYFFQLIYTGAYKFAFVDSGLVREAMGRLLPMYEYALFPACYYLGKTLASNGRTKTVNFILATLSAFILFGVILGFRGDALVLVMATLIGYNRLSVKRVNFRQIFLFCILFTSIFVASILKRAPTIDNIDAFSDFISNNPQFANLTTIEYFAGYYNFSILYANDFKVDYPAQVYVESVKTFFSKFIGDLSNRQTLFYEYRDMFHSERSERSGSSAGTGFSLHYESIMNFHSFYWFLFLFIGYVFMKIDQASRRYGGFFELWPIFLLPYVVTFARSQMPFLELLNKFLYAIVVYILLILITKVLARSRFKADNVDHFYQ